MTRARITGVGAFLPKRILTNADLEKMVDTNDEWIVQRTGIRERRIVDENEATSDLAVRAAQQAIERANLLPEDIEFIAVGTTSPDMIFPTTGKIVQHRLGWRRARARSIASRSARSSSRPTSTSACSASAPRLSRASPISAIAGRACSW